MRPTTTIHRFTTEEIEELKDKTNLEDGVEALERWARHNYPINETGYYNIGKAELNEKGGEIEIIERRV